MKTKVPANKPSAQPGRPPKITKAPAGKVRIIGGKAGEVRLIGGLWKRSKLSVLSKPGLRPTPDRVKETLFNWLGQDLSGIKCLDAFAGSGALGFEAASRGAKDVLLIEADAQLVAKLQESKLRLKAEAIRIQRGDGIAAMRSQAIGSLDVIFIDPPFDFGLYLEAIRAAAGILSAQGAIYLEAPEAWRDEQLECTGLRIIKQGKAGAVHFHLLSRLADQQPSA
jgi:16S rRNA (guanine966-N2)-methyltransferase